MTHTGERVSKIIAPTVLALPCLKLAFEQVVFS